MEDLELRFPIKFSIKTVAENGCSSEAVSTTFSNTIKGSIMVGRKERIKMCIKPLNPQPS